MGTIYSGATAADPTSVYWNPAAMTRLRGSNGQVHFNVSFYRPHYQRDTVSAYDGLPFAEATGVIPMPRPDLNFVTDFGLSKWRFGFTMALPLMEGGSWEMSYGGRPSPTRYYATMGMMVLFQTGLAAAYEVNRYLSVGVGVDLVGMFIDHEMVMDMGAMMNHMACAMDPTACHLGTPFARENPSFDATARVTGLGLGIGAAAGVLFNPRPWVRIGLGFHTGGGTLKIPVKMSGAMPPGMESFMQTQFPSMALPNMNADGEVHYTTPMIVTAGVAVDVTPRIELAFDFHWMQLSETSVMDAIVHVTPTTSEMMGDQVMIYGRNDAFFFALRGLYRFNDKLTFAARAEFDADTRPDQFVNPVTMDFHEFSLHAGVAWRVRPWVTLSLEYAHYFLISRDIERSAWQPNAYPATMEEAGLDKASPTGHYAMEVDHVGFGAIFHF